ncbi:hypothetical protein [Lampropedia puyangensis]|nr:hypothetical protein [Lampropedia puyangensis]
MQVLFVRLDASDIAMARPLLTSLIVHKSYPDKKIPGHGYFKSLEKRLGKERLQGKAKVSIYHDELQRLYAYYKG